MEQRNEVSVIDDKLIQLAHLLFTSAKGQEFIELLKEKYLMAPVYQPFLSDAVGHVREGENNLIRQFMTWVKVYEDRIKHSVKDNAVATGQRAAMKINEV